MESLFIPLLISLAIGTLVGLERESLRIHQKIKTIAGLRTFVFISLWGFLTSIIAKEVNVFFLFVSFAAFVATLLVGYFIYSKSVTTVGLTTVIAATLVFLLTSMTLFVDIRFILAIGILVALALSFKATFIRFLEIIPRQAILATVQFAVLSAVILPFLPNEYIGPWQFFNPYITWWVIVLISGISFVGYLLNIFIGNRGSILITSSIGGLISSTAVTSSLSRLSRTSRLPTNLLYSGLILTSSISFLRILLETSVISQSVFMSLLVPVIAMTIISVIFLFYFQVPKRKSTSESMIFENPFQLRSALGFGLFFILIAFLVKASTMFLGPQGIYITSIFAGLADINAITISVSQLASTAAITSAQAMTGIVLAVISNLWVKLSIVIIFADRTLRKVMILYTFLITVTAVLLSFLLHFFHF